MPKSRKDPFRPRLCRFCKLIFKPKGKNPANAAEQEFCTAAHRKEFWRHGALPFEKLMGKIEKRVREIAREEIEQITEIATAELRSFDRADLLLVLNALANAAKTERPRAAHP